MSLGLQSWCDLKALAQTHYNYIWKLYPEYVKGNWLILVNGKFKVVKKFTNGEIIKNFVIYSVNIESMEDLGF